MAMDNSGVYSIINVGRIFAGPGSIESIREAAADFAAQKALIITDKGVQNAGLIEKPERILKAAGVRVEVISDTPSEPSVDHVNAICAAAKPFRCDMVIGIGGGSAMDVAKIVSILLTNDISVRELLGGAQIRNRGIPKVMVPTTAGTGAEVTQNAIFLVPEEELKIGIVSPKLVPECAILDPELTVGLPPAVTASTGMDALAHAIECYISKKSNPLGDTFALKAIGLIARSIRQAYQNGKDLSARHDMLLGAMFGGMCIAASSTTAVHALAYPLGGKYRIPHGLSNAILLPHVMNFNLDACQGKFRDIAAAMGLPVAGLPAAEAAAAMIDNLYALNRDLNIQVGLKDKGITEADVDFLVDAAAKVTRLLSNNPKPMTKEDIRAIYMKIL